jgi:anti-sigma factor RsiW
MRCSFSEPRLDAFVDGTLAAADQRRVLAHVDGCDRCRHLLEELRVVDALLLVPRQLEPAPNFTFRAMAEVRAMHPPHVRRVPTLGVFATYLAFAWTIIVLWLAFGGTAAREALAVGGAALARYGAGLSGVAGATSQLFGHATPGVTILMGMILLLDACALAVVALVYVVVRPRLAAHLANPSEAT